MPTMKEVTVTGIEIGLAALISLLLFGGGVGTGVAITADNSDKAIAAAMGPMLAELETIKGLTEPGRTPYCDGESDKYDADRCMTVEICAIATGSDTEVTGECQALVNMLVTDALVELSVDYADTYWSMYGADKPAAWKAAKDDFIRQWEKRKG